jgi:hypothetical protein
MCATLWHPQQVLVAKCAPVLLACFLEGSVSRKGRRLSGAQAVLWQLVVALKWSTGGPARACVRFAPADLFAVLPGHLLARCGTDASHVLFGRLSCAGHVACRYDT